MVFQHCRRGFTFIELIFVVTLLAILAVVTVPRFRRSFDSLVLQNFVSDFTSYAMYAQAKSVSGGSEVSVDLDPTQRLLLTEDHVKYQDPSGGNVDQWVTGKVKSIPDLVLVDLKASTGKIVFYPDGTSDSADIDIKGKYSGKYSVSVDPGTGYVNAKQTE